MRGCGSWWSGRAPGSCRMLSDGVAVALAALSQKRKVVMRVAMLRLGLGVRERTCVVMDVQKGRLRCRTKAQTHRSGTSLTIPRLSALDRQESAPHVRGERASTTRLEC